MWIIQRKYLYLFVFFFFTFFLLIKHTFWRNLKIDGNMNTKAHCNAIRFERRNHTMRLLNILLLLFWVSNVQINNKWSWKTMLRETVQTECFLCHLKLHLLQWNSFCDNLRQPCVFFSPSHSGEWARNSVQSNNGWHHDYIY